MNKIEKIIFLDFDGVIVTFETRFNDIDPECAKHLKRVVDETGAFIVISSTWRKHHDFIDLKEMLHNHGISGEKVFAAFERYLRGPNSSH